MDLRDETEALTHYYLNQAGHGYAGVYEGAAYQKGYGIGAYLSGELDGCFKESVY